MELACTSFVAHRTGGMLVRFKPESALQCHAVRSVTISASPPAPQIEK